MTIETLQKQFNKIKRLEELRFNYRIVEHDNGTFTVHKLGGFHTAISDHRKKELAEKKIEQLVKVDYKNERSESN